MEQWVSDTFYSYFPSFNNENQKRQAFLNEQQLENQKNYIKQMSKNTSTNKKNNGSNAVVTERTSHRARSRSFHAHSPTKSWSRSNKTDLEIIVTNPNYVSRSPPIHRNGPTERVPDSRYPIQKKELADQVIDTRNRSISKNELNKKKSYQKELIKKIDEKRKQVEILREKEKMEEDELTRTLEDQLRTVQLEEALEREQLRMNEIQLDFQKNKILRGDLLRKLENDRKLLTERETKSENDKESVQIRPIDDDRKIYKYFSNSAQQEYNSPLRHRFHPHSKFNLDISEQDEEDLEKSIDLSHHDIKDVCPICYTKLKHYQVLCLKCNHSNSQSSPMSCSLSCENCKRQYTICDCCEQEERNKLCKLCQKQRKINSDSKRNICISCGTGMNSSRNLTQIYNPNNLVYPLGSEKSFQILEVNYPENDYLDHDFNLNNYEKRNRPPFSINIDPNSNFYFKGKLPDQKYNLNILHDEILISKLFNENKKLINKNPIKNKKTQNTGTKAKPKLNNKTIVTKGKLYMLKGSSDKNEDNYKNESSLQNEHKTSEQESNWNIPVVERHTITTSSPKVVTQLGAIRKQLQTDAVEESNNQH